MTYQDIITDTAFEDLSLNKNAKLRAATSQTGHSFGLKKSFGYHKRKKYDKEKKEAK